MEESHKNYQATQHRVSVLKKQVASRDRSLEDLRAQLKMASDDLLHSQELAQQLADRMQELKQELSRSQQEVLATKEHYHKGTDHQIATLRISLAESRTDLEGAWGRHSQEQEHSIQLEGQIHGLNEKITYVQAERDEAWEAQHDAETQAARLASEAEDRLVVTAELGSKLKASEEGARTLQADLEGQMSQLQELTRQLRVASELGQQADQQQQQQAAHLAQAEAEIASCHKHLAEVMDSRAQLDDRYSASCLLQPLNWHNLHDKHHDKRIILKS